VLLSAALVSSVTVVASANVTQLIAEMGVISFGK